MAIRWIILSQRTVLQLLLSHNAGMEFTLQILALLFLVALIAGWVDAVAGGGGLITIPVLLLIGVPAAGAIATNKLQGSFGTFTAALYFLRQGSVTLKGNVLALLTVCAGSVLGGWALTRVDASYLNYLVPILLILTAIYFLFFAGNLDERREPRLTANSYNLTAAPALGFYDGFFGPGTGSFMATSFVTLRGFSIRQATAHAKLFNFASNIAALVYFIFFGKIVWLAGLAMIGGQILGAYLGARTALNAGAKLIRPLTIVVCCAMSLRALWSLFN